MANRNRSRQSFSGNVESLMLPKASAISLIISSCNLALAELESGKHDLPGIRIRLKDTLANIANENAAGDEELAAITRVYAKNFGTRAAARKTISGMVELLRDKLRDIRTGGNHYVF